MIKRPLLVLAVVIVILINIGLLQEPFTGNTWDSETHIFFADHYQRSWFNPWESRWYGGFLVYCSAPLVHQMVALLGFLFDLEIGYRLLQALTLIALPISVWLFTKEILEEKYADWAALLSTGVSGVYIVLYAFGQLPTFVALILSLLACTLLARYLRYGTWYTLLGYAFLTSAAVATHHYTVILMLPFLIVTVTITRWVTDSFSMSSLYKLLIAGSVSALVFVLAIAPFWWWYLTQSLPQNEIVHPTRQNFLIDPVISRLFLWDMYGGILLLIPLGIWATRKKHALLPLNVLIVFLGIMGLGGVTSIPQIMLGNFWDILTYERFAFWAAVLAVVPISVWLEGIKKHKALVYLGVSTILIIGLMRAISLPMTQELLQKPLKQWEETEVVKFLNEHDQWNYLTLGLGEPEMARLSRLTAARNIDGFYNQARSREELRMSGIGAIDESPWLRKPTLLSSILLRPWEWNLRWIVCEAPWFETHLRLAGWTLLHPIGSSISYQKGDVYYSFVTIWEAPKDAVERMKPNDVNSENLNHTGFIPKIVLPVWWGIVPILSLILGLTFMFNSYRDLQ